MRLIGAKLHERVSESAATAISMLASLLFVGGVFFSKPKGPGWLAGPLRPTCEGGATCIGVDNSGSDWSDADCKDPSTSARHIQLAANVLIDIKTLGKGLRIAGCKLHANNIPLSSFRLVRG